MSELFAQGNSVHLQPIKSHNVIMHRAERKGLTPQFQHTTEKKRERGREIEGVLHMCTERARAHWTNDVRYYQNTDTRLFLALSVSVFFLPSLTCFLRCIHLHTNIKVATCPKTTRVGNTVPEGFAGIWSGIEFVSSAHRSKARGERWGRLDRRGSRLGGFKCTQQNSFSKYKRSKRQLPPLLLPFFIFSPRLSLSQSVTQSAGKNVWASSTSRPPFTTTLALTNSSIAAYFLFLRAAEACSLTPVHSLQIQNTSCFCTATTVVLITHCRSFFSSLLRLESPSQVKNTWVRFVLGSAHTLTHTFICPQPLIRVFIYHTIT